MGERLVSGEVRFHWNLIEPIISYGLLADMVGDV